MKRKIIVVLALTLLSAILFVPLTKAQGEFNEYAWVDKVQYAPGESGTLYITMRNDMAEYVYVYNITITYPWRAYVEDHWEGNETIEVKETVAEDGGVLNKEFTFEVPEDGRAVTTSSIRVEIYTEQWIEMLASRETVLEEEWVSISIANPPVHMAVKDMDMWMTSLTVVIVICTIILAIVVFLSTRKARAPRMLAPPPPPPKPKAKAA